MKGRQEFAAIVIIMLTLWATAIAVGFYALNTAAHGCN